VRLDCRPLGAQNVQTVLNLNLFKGIGLSRELRRQFGDIGIEGRDIDQGRSGLP